jgi:maleylacetoacetate isomerase
MLCITTTYSFYCCILCGVAALEEVLQGSAGKFCVGNDVTIADLCLVPQVYNAVKFNADLSRFPIIRRINDACLSQDFFKAAAPDAQPDNPADQKK